MQLWTDVFRRDLDEGVDPAITMRLHQARRADVPRLGTRAPVERRSPRARRGAARRHQGDAARRCRRSIAYVHGVRDVEKPAECQGQPARQSQSGSATRCRAASSRCLSDRRAARRSRRAAAAWSWPSAIARAADRHARHRQSRLEGALRHRHRRHAEQLRHERRAAGASRAARVPGASRSSRTGMSIKKLHRADHAERGLPARRRARSRRTPTRTPATGSYWRANRQRMTAEQLRDSVLFVSGALDTKMGGPSGAADAVLRAPHDLRQGEPLSARSVPAAVRLSRRRPSPPSSASPPTCRCSGCS